MSIKIPKSAPSVSVEAGTYIARCYRMIHIGTISYEWQGEIKTANKVQITFELPTETKVFVEGESAKPIVISQEYTLSLSTKSKLRPLLESWRGKAFTDEEADNFEISKLVGVPAFISVIQNEKGYSEISSITKLPKGMECPPQVNQSEILDYEDWSDEKFAKLPEFIQNKMKKSKEYIALKGGLTETEMKNIAEKELLESVPF